LAVQVDDGTESNISVYDLSGASAIRRLTFGGQNRFPVWSADGERLAFQSDREGDAGVFWQRADGTGPAERLTKPDAGTAHIPSAWSPDGRWLLFRAVKGNASTLWTLSFADRKTAPFSAVQSSLPSGAVFSPDGRWVAYAEGDGNARGVYVQPFPATGAGYQVAKGGTTYYPVWSRDGEIFYISEIGGFGVVRVTTQPAVAFGPVVRLARGRSLVSNVNDARIFDVTPDGKRSIWAIDAESQTGAPAAPQIQVVLNWFEELKAKAPVRRQ
jgi:Tol biopolymer transport system component